MNNDYYELAKKNGWVKNFLQQLETTNKAIANDYNQQRSAVNKQYDNSIAQYNPQKYQARQTANQTGRNAYVNYMKSVNPFSATQNSLARSGLSNSGYAESLGLKANSDYMTNVGNALTTRDLALANIDNQINSLENERENSLAELLKNKNNDLRENYYKIYGLRQDEIKRQEAEAKENASSNGGGSSYTYSSPSYTTSSYTTPKQKAKKYTAGGGGHSKGGGGNGAFGGGGGGSRGKKTKSKTILGKMLGKIRNLFQIL